MVGSVVAGLSQNTGMLIACRVVQGIGVGGLSALAQIIMAAMISPRERGRYSGYLGATFAVATVGGPLLGGVITDTDWLGWRWCFYVGVPFAVIALIVLQKTLQLPGASSGRSRSTGPARFFISAAVSLLLVWVTFAGNKYDWMSWQTVRDGRRRRSCSACSSSSSSPRRASRSSRCGCSATGRSRLASRRLAVRRCRDVRAAPSSSASTSSWRAASRPTMSGVMTIPMIGGLFVSSTVSGQIITRTGRWKVWLVTGGVLLTAGLGLLGTHPVRHRRTGTWRSSWRSWASASA